MYNVYILHSLFRFKEYVETKANNNFFKKKNQNLQRLQTLL